MDDFNKELARIDDINGYGANGITNKNINRYVDENLKEFIAEQTKAREEQIQKQVERLKDYVHRYYTTSEFAANWHYHFVPYGIFRDGKKGLKQIDDYFLPEAISEYRKKSGLRCLKVRMQDMFFEFRDYRVYFIITNLENAELINELKAAGFATYAKVIKEYV